MVEKLNYSLLLESRGVAQFRQRPEDTQLEELKKLVAHLTSINPNGGDNRREIKDAPALAQKLAKSVALIFDAPLLNQQPNGMWKLRTQPAGLISGQAFLEQPKVRDGFTGFLVGKDLLLTTAHSVDVGLLRIVFDFILDENDVPKTTYASSEVFTVKKEVSRGQNENTGEDWLLLQLDRSPGRPYLGIESQAAPHESPLWMLGHPLGLPMKFVDSAVVTKAGSVVFECDLDASEGNSGSMVLTPEAGAKVVGVLQATAVGVDLVQGLWLWCPMNGNCPTFVTSSPAFAAAVAAAVGP